MIATNVMQVQLVELQPPQNIKASSGPKVLSAKLNPRPKNAIESLDGVNEPLADDTQLECSSSKGAGWPLWFVAAFFLPQHSKV